jgi:DNA polymerase-3 subunit gamma/tau
MVVRPAAPPGYRVLARKYRPPNFPISIGQEPMVRTLRNAFSTGRIHQAYISHRRARRRQDDDGAHHRPRLNYELRTARAGPTVDLPSSAVHCQAILESRHVDVIEMDAASHTGIDDIREIIDGVRYGRPSARYKVYIIDEVHMLSDAGLQRPAQDAGRAAPHVKFMFATTEIRKVPVTVLSRCQRFDLRRIDRRPT